VSVANSRPSRDRVATRHSNRGRSSTLLPRRDSWQIRRFAQDFSPEARPASLMLEAFLLFEFACQLALAFTALGSVRVLVRIAAFAASLALLAVPRRALRAHPAEAPAIWIVLILVLSIFNPYTNNWLAGFAQASLYAAILAPLFWVSRSGANRRTLYRLLFIMWAFQTVSAAVGVLQFYFPGHFQPNLSAVVASLGDAYVKDLHLATPDGRWILRPMGLSDIPGAAAMAGFWAVLLGIGFFISQRAWWMRVVCAASVSVGTFCIFLSQVRSALAVLIVSVIAFGALLMWRGQKLQSMVLAAVLAVFVVAGFHFAASVGGNDVASRLAAFTDHPESTFVEERGRFLLDTIDVLPQYPLGAGLARWGMVNHYFGDDTNLDSAPIWVEIQWTGWLLDGGLPLVIAYVIALAVTIRMTMKLALTRDQNRLWPWPAIIFGYDIGVLANTFSYPVFIGQSGLEFWLFNALLFAAARTETRRPGKR